MANTSECDLQRTAKTSKVKLYYHGVEPHHFNCTAHKNNLTNRAMKLRGELFVSRLTLKETQDHNYIRKTRQRLPRPSRLPVVKVVPWAAALPAAAAGEATEAEEPAMMADVLEAAVAEAEAAEGGEVAVIAAADTEAASSGDSPTATIVEIEDPQDSKAEESGTDAAKSKRTIANMLGYGGYTPYNSASLNALPHDAPAQQHRFQHAAYHAASQQQPQYSHPSQGASQHVQPQQQYQTLRYYPTKAAAAAAEQVASAPSGGRPHYQIQYQYQLPAQYQPAPQIQHYYPVAQQLVAAASAAQPVVYQHPAASHATSAHALFGGQQQLIPVILVRVADPSQHGLASAALLPASALGLHAAQAAPAAAAGHGLGLQGLQGLLLQHYMQQAAAHAAAQAAAAAQVPTHAHAHAPTATYYTQDTPQLTQQQLKQLYAQQQAAAAAASAAEGKKPIVPTAAPNPSTPQKPRKPSSVSIEPAHNLDNSYQQYKFSNYKEKN